MKIYLKPVMIAAALSAVSMASAENDLLSFPGAEGFGRYTLGARAVENPQIYHVTNLDDSGPGSFRDAVSGEGRIIIFDVAGTIKLNSALVVKGNNTILGQTAPGEGVQVYGDRISFSNANNLIVRHMRFRMGVGGTGDNDACGIANGTDMIFDHLSVLWGKDENFSVNWDNKNQRPANITIQNSIIGQGLQSHSCGGLIQTIGGVTLYRNLYIENKTRNPKVKGLNQFVNNVVYNWGNGGCYIMSDSEGDSWADIENNYFMKGPWNSATAPFTRGVTTFRYYGSGNYYDDNVDGELNGHLMTVEEMSGRQSDTQYSTYFDSLDALNGNIAEYNQTASELVQSIPEISEILTAEDAYAWILANVGPLPVRDDVDQYIIDEMASYGIEGTKNGISSENQLPHKGTGVISGGMKPLDTDNDGIPDEWEIANGLNPNDPSDAVKLNPEGYTYIEAYSHTITGPYPYIKKPINLEITEIGKNSLSLSWELNKNTENGFEIEISTDGQNFTKVAETAAEITSAVLDNLDEYAYYYVRVRAAGNGLASDYSNVAEAETTDDPTAAPQIRVTGGNLVNEIEYTDGAITIVFNQDVVIKSQPEFAGLHQYEQIDLSVSGSTLKITYDALDANYEYAIIFSEGQLTNADSSRSFVGEIKLNTGDFTAAKAQGDNHWGKAAANLPLNFMPFNVTAPFETVGGLVQSQKNDYPHWVQTNGGEITADYVAFNNNSSSDKVMAYFDGCADRIYVKMSAEEGATATVKIQETRNPDNGAPTWRTIRVLTEKDMPFEDELTLNPEARFVKIVPTAISGTVRLLGFRISDAEGYFGDDYTFENGVENIFNAGDDDNAPVYNVMGLPVDSSYKGIVIKNGKKYIQR